MRPFLEEQRWPLVAMAGGLNMAHLHTALLIGRHRDGLELLCKKKNSKREVRNYFILLALYCSACKNI